MEWGRRRTRPESVVADYACGRRRAVKQSWVAHDRGCRCVARCALCDLGTGGQVLAATGPDWFPDDGLPVVRTQHRRRDEWCVEEAAYRRYMQTGLDRVDPSNAVLITSLVFVGSHITQGVGAVLLLGPGLFVSS